MTHNRMLEAQIVQKAAFLSVPSDRLPSRLEFNPREGCNAMLLRGGKQLEGPKEITSDEPLHDRNQHVGMLRKKYLHLLRK